MQQAQRGNMVKIAYHSKTQDKKYTISSQEKGPIKFKIGMGSVPLGIEKAVIGMRIGEKRRITLNPEEGFGKKSAALTLLPTRALLPEKGCYHLWWGDSEPQNLRLCLRV